MKLEKTRDYTLFVPNDEQRPLDERHASRIAESIDVFGFLPSKPVQCYRRGNKLVVVDGHHRLSAAKAARSEVYYVIEESRNQEAMAMENSLVKKWATIDYVRLFALRGNSDYQELLTYESQGLPLNMTASMLAGEGAASGNVLKYLSSGLFKIKTRKQVDVLLSLFNDFGDRVPAVKSRPFIAAFSKCLFTREFDPDVFARKLNHIPSLLEKTSNADQMLKQIEDIYNWKSTAKIPLAFLVNKTTSDRKTTFGRTNQ